MKEEFIKTVDGIIIGIIETSSNGDQLARDFASRKILGYYRAKYNDTTDFYGRVIGRGNLLASLIWQAKK